MEEITSEPKEGRKLRILAIASILSFFIAIIKDILVSYLQIIPARSPANFRITYFIVIPVVIAGCVCSIAVISENYRLYRKYNRRFFDINLVLSLIVPLCILLTFIGLLIGISNVQ